MNGNQTNQKSKSNPFPEKSQVNNIYIQKIRKL